MAQLFNSEKLSDVLERKRQAMIAEINRIDPQMLIDNIEKQTLRLESKYRVHVPKLACDRVTQEEVAPTGSGRTLVRSRVPFEGDPIFTYIPSQAGSNVPTGEIGTDYIELNCSGDSPEEVKADLNRQIKHIEEYLEWAMQDVEAFNENLKDKVQRMIQEIGAKIERENKLIEGLRSMGLLNKKVITDDNEFGMHLLK